MTKIIIRNNVLARIVLRDADGLRIRMVSAPGIPGPPGPGLPVGGTTGQVPVKVSNSDYDIEWQDQSGSGGIASVDPVGNTPTPEGATIAGNTLTLQPADGTHPGVLTAGYQEIGGKKDFLNGATFVGSADVQFQGTIRNYSEFGFRIDNYQQTINRPPLTSNTAYFRGNDDEGRMEYGKFGQGWKLIAFVDDIPAATPPNVFIQEAAPIAAYNFAWFELNPDKTLKTLWINTV